MFGAIFGDIVGSYYEVHSTKKYDFKLEQASSFTDDSVLCAAVCKAILEDPSDITKKELTERARQYAVLYKQFYSYFPYVGFGNAFSSWAQSKRIYKQYSFGNGAAMRAIPIGYAYKTIDQVLLQARASSMFTHNTKEAIAGAQAVAAVVWLANNGSSKDEICKYLEKNFKYKLSIPIRKFHDEYVFDSKTNYSVPPSISCFLESSNYESAIRLAVSLGGDADTMACIAGGIAEAFYHQIPKYIEKFCFVKLDSTINLTVNKFCGTYITKKTEYV